MTQPAPRAQVPSRARDPESYVRFSFEKPVPRVELGEDWLDQMLSAPEPLRIDR